MGTRKLLVPVIPLLLGCSLEIWGGRGGVVAQDGVFTGSFVRLENEHHEL